MPGFKAISICQSTFVPNNRTAFTPPSAPTELAVPAHFLAAVRVDVVASNPWFRIHDKADKQLDDLVAKALKHNPDIRVLVQVGWLPYDDPVFQRLQVHRMRLRKSRFLER